MKHLHELDSHCIVDKMNNEDCWSKREFGRFVVKTKSTPRLNNWYCMSFLADMLSIPLFNPLATYLPILYSY